MLVGDAFDHFFLLSLSFHDLQIHKSGVCSTGLFKEFATLASKSFTIKSSRFGHYIVSHFGSRTGQDFALTVRIYLRRLGLSSGDRSSLPGSVALTEVAAASSRRSGTIPQTSAS